MKTDITYDQLKSHLTKENRLWVEDDATRNTEGHEGGRQAWQRLFGCSRESETLVVRLDGGDHFPYVLQSGRVYVGDHTSDEIFQLPEAAMRELGLIAMSPALGAPYGGAETSRFPADQENASNVPKTLREALGEEIPATPSTGRRFGEGLARIKNVSLMTSCLGLLSNTEFSAWPAALGHHHAREGGLLDHTLEVIDIALHIAAKFPDVNKNVLIAAALWHDYGKLFEYVHTDLSGSLQDGQSILVQRCDEQGVTHGWFRDPKAVHHCISSAQEFIVAARQHGVDRATEDAVVHCILSHHGPVKEWGSPVAPESLEAWVLHWADMASARFGATK